MDSEAQLIWHRENGWKEVCLDPQAAWLVQGRIDRAARNIASKSLPVHMGRTAATCCYRNRRAMDTRIAWGVRRAERTGGRDNANTKRQAGNSLRQEKDLKFFCCKCNYMIHWSQTRIYRRSNNRAFLHNHREPRRKLLSAWPLGGNSTT